MKGTEGKPARPRPESGKLRRQLKWILERSSTPWTMVEHDPAKMQEHLEVLQAAIEVLKAVERTQLAAIAAERATETWRVPPSPAPVTDKETAAVDCAALALSGLRYELKPGVSSILELYRSGERDWEALVRAFISLMLDLTTEHDNFLAAMFDKADRLFGEEVTESVLGTYDGEQHVREAEALLLERAYSPSIPEGFHWPKGRLGLDAWGDDDDVGW